MTRKHSSIDQLSTASTRQAQSEMAMMQRDLKKLRDSVAGLTHGIKAPKIKAPHPKTKKITDSPSFLGSLANFAAGDLLGMAGLSGGGYTSAMQKAGSNLAMLALGQRVR
jgi:ABC-type sugar transport system ATPase subunit